MQHIKQWSICASVCLLFAGSMTGCSTFESGYALETEAAVSPNAMASLGNASAPDSFGLVAADSVGMATFGFEIAQWNEMPADETLAQRD